jgi:hypothetical protein
MAGEISQDVAIALALGSAAIGAGGSIISQIVGGVITSRREQKKAEAEDRRRQVENEAKRRDRQLDRKIELLSKFLSAAERAEQTPTWGRPLSSEELQEHDDTLVQLRVSVEEIGLLVPDLYRFADNIYDAVRYMLLHMVVAESKWEEKSSERIGNAQDYVAFLISLTRVAVRSYINHEPVEWPEHAIAEYHAQRKNETQQSTA